MSGISVAFLVMYMWAHAQIGTVNGRPLGPGCHLEHIVTAEGTAINTSLCGEVRPNAIKLSLRTFPPCRRCIRRDAIAAGYLGGLAQAVRPPLQDEPYWTCRDKSRILLTAEDGTKHCLKFGERR